MGGPQAFQQQLKPGILFSRQQLLRRLRFLLFPPTRVRVASGLGRAPIIQKRGLDGTVTPGPTLHWGRSVIVKQQKSRVLSFLSWEVLENSEGSWAGGKLNVDDASDVLTARVLSARSQQDERYVVLVLKVSQGPLLLPPAPNTHTQPHTRPSAAGHRLC